MVGVDDESRILSTTTKKSSSVIGRNSKKMEGVSVGGCKLKFMIESERVLEVLFIFAILKLTWLFVRTYLSPLTPIVL